MLIAALIYAAVVAPSLAVFLAAGRADRAIESSREGRETARFAEPYIEIQCEVRGACRLAFTREEWAEMSCDERDRAVRDAAMIGASVAWRYTPKREGAAR